MDTPERSEGALSPWSPPSAAILPASAAWNEPPPEAGPPRAFSPKVVLRALRRHWWRILAIWLVGSSALVYLAYTRIRPTYDAISLLNIEPASRSLLAQNSGLDFGPYLDTQVILVTSPDVLAGAISDPDIAALPKIRASEDPEVDLRKEIAVLIPQKGTHVIMVKMTGENADEAAAIVNAVVKSYRDMSVTWTTDEMKARIETLKVIEKQFNEDIAKQRSRVRSLAKKTGEDPGDELRLVGKDGKAAPEGGEGGALGKHRITLDEYRDLRRKLTEVNVGRITAQAAVTFLDQERKRRAGGPVAAPLTEEQVADRVNQEFLASPAAQQINGKMHDVEDNIRKLKGRVRSSADPTVKRLNQQLADLQDQWTALWDATSPGLRRRVVAAADGTGPALDGSAVALDAELNHARMELNSMKIQEKLLEEQLRSVAVEARAENDDIWEVKFANEDLSRTEDALAKVTASLQQMDYESKSGTRITVVSKAKAIRTPSSNNRNKMMAAAPVLMLLLTCGLFVLAEAKSGRVADPDELSQRVRVGVIGVVPPLPSLNGPARPLSPRGQQAERRRVEEFIQSLDHLRVTLCAQRPGMSSRRCVLITSATGGEGKTTLAAQLAGRCANAGLMTLLIDADLRRPSLGDLLEVPEGPGLVDVLTGDAAAEAAMVVIGNAGGFHLLPAGTIGQDPSRLLHGERLGQIIARFRETFDIVIIDAPPVLAVPDALLLGRWTDGAILAVRHDASRFPLVERANKRLTSIGVPVIGAVVNGCRTMESAYGAYRYTPYAAAEAPGAGGDAEI